MPKATSYTPAWLSKRTEKPTPGHDVFVASPKQKDVLQDNVKKAIRAGPRRTIARRGTSEIFVAVGKEIRWTDLAKLKENWDGQTQGGSYLTGKSHGGGSDDDKQPVGYRVIKTECTDEIRQLVISPNEDLIAILTTHTVHILVLPDPTHLKSNDKEHLNLKKQTFMLGPTTHVTTQSAIASALWHPLGKNGYCIVTVTEESIVRVWELNLANRNSFDRPTLSIDLKKLIDGKSIDEDFSASKMGMSKGFSPDSYDMEVASACFGERDSGDWSSMTLWIAMREGDVYALCPLLPEKWSPTPVLMASLSVSIVSKAVLAEQDPDISDEDKFTCQQQLEWMQDLDMQDPTTGGEEGAETDVYTRPDKPGKIPKLQGPFDIEFQQEEGDDDMLLSDILVIGAKLDADELMFGEDDSLLSDETENGGLSVGVICLLSSSGRVTICLDIDGVEAQWLPHSRAKVYHSFAVPEEPALIAFQSVETLRPDEVDEESWPMFSTDCNSRYSFFVTSTSSISFLSLSPWIFHLESELRNSSDGLPVRLGNLVKGPNSTRERVFPSPNELSKSKHPLAGSIVLRDPDLGYFLLSATKEGPIMISFDSPEFAANFGTLSPSPSQHENEDLDLDGPLQLYQPRNAYQPPQVLEQNSMMPTLLDKLRHSKYKRLMNEHVRLSPATLNVMTDTHKVVSEESDRIREAAAELFRRCQKLQNDLKDQIQKANDVARRVDDVLPSTPQRRGTQDSEEEGEGKEPDSKDKPTSNDIIQARIQAAKKKQTALAERLSNLRSRIVKNNGRDLSAREQAWIEEVKELSKTLKIPYESDKDSQPPSKANENEEDDDDDSATEDGRPGRKSTAPWKRFEEVQALKQDLLRQAKEITIERKEGESDRRGSMNGGRNSMGNQMNVPRELRKAKLDQINKMLAREQALVENMTDRLEGLSI